MSTRIAVFSLLLAALAGVVLIWSGSGDPAGSDGGAAAPATRAGADRGVAAPGAADLARPEVARAEGPAPGERQALAAVPQSAPEPERAAPTDMRLAGRVVDRLGNPIPGTTVRVRREGDPFGFLRSDEVETVEVETDDAGRFEARAPSQEALVVSARAAGFAPLDEDGVVPRSAGVTELDDIVLTRGAVLRGIVVDADGRSVAGAELHGQDPHGSGLFFGGSREPLATTGDDGRFDIEHLACGPWQIRVSSDEHPPGVFEGLAERPGEVVDGLEFELPRGNSIEGRLTAVPSETDLEQVVVRAYLEAGDGFWATFGPGTREARVDASGNFRLLGLRTGKTYRLQARRERPGRVGFGSTQSLSEAVDAQPGDRGVVLPFQPEATLTLQVIDAETGEPIERMLVSGGMRWPQPLRDAEGKVQRDFDEGHIVFGDLRRRDETSRFTLEISAVGYQDYRREDVEITPGQGTDLGVVRLFAVPIVRVTVLDDDTGRPIEGALASLTIQSEEEAGFGQRRMRFDVDVTAGDEEPIVTGADDFRSARTDEVGVAAITSFEGERCLLKVNAEGFAPQELADLVLPRGERVDRVVRLSRGASVTVTVVSPEGDPVSGIELGHKPPSAASGPRIFDHAFGHGRRVTDADGRLRFEHLAPGVHGFKIQDSRGPAGHFAGQRVVIRADGMEEDDSWTQLDVGERGEHELTLQTAVRGGLRGRVTESGVALAGATLSLREAGEESMEQRAMRLSGFGGGGPEARTDGDGEYEFEDVEEGDWMLEVSHQGREMSSEFEVAIGAGSKRFNIDLPLSVIEGRIVDLAGKPVAGARVSVERAVGEGGARPQAFRVMMIADDGAGEQVSFSDGSEPAPGVTDAEGYYSLRGVTPDVDLVVKAEHATSQPAESETVRVGVDEVEGGIDIVLQPGGKIDVSVARADGSAVSFQMVTATFLGDSDEPVDPERGFVGPSGNTTLTGLRPGPWRVDVNGVGPRAEGEPQEMEVEVEVGRATPASFTLP